MYKPCSSVPISVCIKPIGKDKNQAFISTSKGPHLHEPKSSQFKICFNSLYKDPHSMVQNQPQIYNAE